MEFYESHVKDKNSIKLNAVDTTKMFDFTGLSADHYEFLKKQIGIKKYSQIMKYRFWADSKRKQHAKELSDLQKTVDDPLKYLNRIKESQLEQLHNAVSRVDQAFRHGILLATIPSSVETMNDVFMGRIQRASKQAYNNLKLCLETITQLCAAIPEVYHGIDLTSYKEAMISMSAIIRGSSPQKERPTTAIPPAVGYGASIPSASGHVADVDDAKPKKKRRKKGKTKKRKITKHKHTNHDHSWESDYHYHSEVENTADEGEQQKKGEPCTEDEEEYSADHAGDEEGDYKEGDDTVEYDEDEDGDEIADDVVDQAQQRFSRGRNDSVASIAESVCSEATAEGIKNVMRSQRSRSLLAVGSSTSVIEDEGIGAGPVGSGFASSVEELALGATVASTSGSIVDATDTVVPPVAAAARRRASSGSAGGVRSKSPVEEVPDDEDEEDYNEDTDEDENEYVDEDDSQDSPSESEHSSEDEEVQKKKKKASKRRRDARRTRRVQKLIALQGKLDVTHLHEKRFQTTVLNDIIRSVEKSKAKKTRPSSSSAVASKQQYGRSNQMFLDSYCPPVEDTGDDTYKGPSSTNRPASASATMPAASTRRSTFRKKTRERDDEVEKEKGEEEEEEPFNDYPCYFCGNMYRGSGKVLPNMLSWDELAMQKAKKRCKANKSLFPTYEVRVDTRWKPPKLNKLSPDGTLSSSKGGGRRTLSPLAKTGDGGEDDENGKEQGLNPRLPLNPSKISLVKSIIHSRVENSKQFCSWECVKGEMMTGVPVHFRYEKEMLVNIAAGYEVSYPDGFVP